MATETAALPRQTIRDGWRLVKFGDVVRQTKVDADPESSGLERYVAGEHMDTDDLHIRRWGTIGDGYLGPAFHRRFKSGQVLYGSRRTYLRKVAVARFEGITANTTFVLESAGDVLLPELLPFVMQTDAFNEHSVRQSRGSVNPYVNFRDLSDYTFPLPPREEQRRIADILWAADAAVERWREAAVSLVDTQVAQASSFFERVQAPFVQIGQIAAVKNGTTPSRKQPEYWMGGVIPWLPTGKVHEREIVAADEFITERALKECSLSLLPAGTILVAMIGQGKTRGSVARIHLPATINQNFAAVIPGPDVDSRFLYYYLASSYEALRHASQGSNQGALNCSLISRFPVPFPTIEEQTRLADSLDRFNESHSSLLKHALKCRRMAVQLREALLSSV